MIHLDEAGWQVAIALYVLGILVVMRKMKSHEPSVSVRFVAALIWPLFPIYWLVH